MRDGAGREIYAEMSLEKADRLQLTVPGQWLAEAEYPVVIDPLIGDPTIISNPPGAAAQAALAYNSAANEYLLVWEDTRNGVGSDLYGQRLAG